MRTPRPARSGARATERRPRPATAELLYGRNAVRESLRAGRRRFTRMLVSGFDEAGRIGEIAALATERGLRVEHVERRTLDALVAGNHQGIALEATPYPYAEGDDLAALAGARRVLLALDGIVDPRNVGTLLRTAEATGVALVVIPTDRAAGVTPAVVNASSGAVEHLRVAREVNLARWLDAANAAGFWVVGLAGEPELPSLFEVDMLPPVVVVVGSEGAGLRRLVRERCDTLAAIPMVGEVASLNAAVAGSLALYEALRDATTD